MTTNTDTTEMRCERCGYYMVCAVCTKCGWVLPKHIREALSDESGDLAHDLYEDMKDADHED